MSKTIIKAYSDAAGVSVSTDKDPANLSDSEATMLGQKQYIVGTDLSLTNVFNSFSATRGVCIPYKMQDGTWRLRFNITGTQLAGNFFNFSFDGVTFKTGVDQGIEVSCPDLGANQAVGDYKATGGSGAIAGNTNGGSNMTNLRIFGDVELDSKPTWAS